MLTILSITAPIYLIIAGGFLSVRFGLFEQRDARVLGRFVADFCVPALLFRALSSRPLSEITNGRFLLAYGLGSLLVFFGARHALQRWRELPPSQATMTALGMSSSNSAYIGFPIASQLLGPPAAVGLALVMIVENLVVIPIALALADRGDGRGAPSWAASLLQSLKALLRNPMIVAILAGFAVAVLDVDLPEFIERTVQIVAAAASPTALFVIGATLVGLRLEGMRRDVASITAGKLLLHPLAAMLGLELLLPSQDPLRAAGVVYAMVPMLSIYPVLAQKHALQGLAAAALLVTTVASFVTISFWLWSLRALVGWVY